MQEGHNELCTLLSSDAHEVNDLFCHDVTGLTRVLESFDMGLLLASEPFTLGVHLRICFSEQNQYLSPL